MSRLYIVNCTTQPQIICYRLDFGHEGAKGRPFQTSPRIPPGRQIPLGGDLEFTQIEEIVKQLDHFGLVAAKDVNRVKGHVPYIFNIDQPVQAAAIRAVLQHNRGQLTEQGRKMRENAALSASSVSEGDNFEVSIEQEEVGEDDSRLTEGYKIAASLDQAEQVRVKRGRPRKSV